jgi:hypothetical protein
MNDAFGAAHMGFEELNKEERHPQVVRLLRLLFAKPGMNAATAPFPDLHRKCLS